MKRYIITLLLTVSLLIPALTNTQSVKVTGEVTTPLTVDKATFETFKRTTVVRKDRDGKDHSYSGVILSDIIQKAGVTLGAALRGEDLTKYVLTEAADGYQITFALAELDKNLQIG